MSLANTVLSEEEVGLVNDCAGRLRIIQGDAAAIEAEKRQEYLREEVSHSFKGLTPARRRVCLQGLLARFPVAGQLAHAATPASVPAPAAPVALTPADLLQRLLSVAGELTQEQRADFARRLFDAGFVWVDRGAVELEISKDLQTRFGLAADQQPRLERMVELAALLVQTLCDLDRTAMSALKDLYPKASMLGQTHDFRQAAGQYLAGSQEEIKKHLRYSTILLGGMLLAMQRGGRDFGKQFLEKYSTEAIEDAVNAAGGGGIFTSKKERCWDQYCRLYRDIATPELLDRWLKECLGRFADLQFKTVK
jgi:hypothetical protein